MDELLAGNVLKEVLAEEGERERERKGLTW